MKTKSLLIFLYFILIISIIPASAQLAGNWKIVGPIAFPTNSSGQINGIGRTTQLKFHPTNSLKMYATTATGGLYISSDAGSTWNTTGTDNLFRTNCASICIDYTNDQILYLGTGDPNYYSTYSGILKSIDGGATWVASNTGIGNRMALEILMSPSDHNVLIAATNDGIWKSTDGGANWTNRKSGGDFTDMIFKPGDANIVYAATHTQFWRSTDMGNTWTQITLSGSGLQNGGRIGVSKADANVVYVTFVGDFGSGVSTPVFKSTNSGQSFSVVKAAGQPNLNGYSGTEDGQGNYNYSITGDPANANTVYIASHVVWKSTDGGANWTQLTNWYAKVHTDMHQIVFSPYDNTKIYNMNDGGVWLSTDGGNNWTTKSYGLSCSEIYRASQSPIRKDMMDIGTQDNGELNYTGTTWYTNGGGDYGGHTAFDYQNNQDVYHLNDASRKRMTGGGSPASFSRPFTDSDGNGNNTEIDFNPLQTNTAFMSYTDVYRTTNLSSGPPTWTKISNFNTQVQSLVSSPSDMNILYAVTDNNTVYRSDNALAASPTFTTLTAPGATNVRASIAPIKNNSNVVYISCGSKVYRSVDKGATWTNISTGLPNVNIIKIIHDKYSTDESVYLAMATAVYYRNNTMTSWMNFSNNLPTIANINELMIFNDGTANSELRVGYYGRGVWGSTLFNNTNSFVTISSPADGDIIAPGTNLAINASVLVGSGKTISKVEFYYGTTLIGTSTTSPYSVTWNNVPAGKYALTAKAYETSGTIVTSAIVNINVSPIGMTAYQDCNYGGYSVGLVEGSYTLSQLQALGINNDDISSIKVQSGYQVILYADDNFQGTTLTLTADNSCLVANSFNDNASSIKIIKINASPTVAITAPANNTVYATAPATVNITATAADSDGTIAKVEFYNGTTLLGTSTTSPYSYNWTGVASGTYTLTAKAYDNNGASTTSAAITIRVNKVPTVTITAPANNAVYITAPATVNITATATDTDGTIAKVEFYSGTTLLGTSTTSPYGFSWTNVAAGTYTLTAKAYDNNGTITTSGAITVRVNQSPTVTITAPANNAIYTTAPAAVNITATAADADGTISKVEFYNGTALIGTLTTSPYSYSWTGVTSGTYTLTAKAYDNNGAITTSVAITIRVNKAPLVSITAPANNAVYTTAPATVNITATATDTDGSITKVEFYNGTTLLGTSTASQYTYNWTGVATGTYTITAKAYDNDGIVTTSSAISFRVNKAPSVSITAPANNATFIASATINITAAATDTDGSISKVEFYSGTTLIGTSTTSPYSFSWTNVAAGSYTLTAKAYDNDGVITTSGVITVIVNNNTAPTVSITAPANNAVYVNAPASVNITATASDIDGTISKVEFYNGTTLLGSSTTSPYTFNWTNVAAGTYTLTAKAYDNLIATTTSTATTIIVNAAPIVSVTSPANNATFTSPATVNITATANDADGTISKVEFYNGATLLGTSITSPYIFNWTNVAAGTYSLTAKAYDNRGATAISSSISIVVNTPANVPPTVSITSPVNNATFIAPASVTFNANASDADGTISKVEFYNGTTLLGSSTTNPYSYIWTNVSAGTYSITAKAYDNLGATATSAVVNIIVNNNSSPLVSITSPSNNASFTEQSTISITANASDSDGSIAKVEFYNGTTLLSTSTSGPYSFNWANVPTGTYTIIGKAYDNLGATTTASINVIVKANVPPVVSITSPLNNSSFMEQSSINISANASDSDGSITKVEFYNGSLLLSTSTSSPYSYTWVNVAPGNYIITAKAYDNLRATTTASVNVIVNANKTPIVSITSPLNSATFIGPANINIAADASDSDGRITKVEFYNGSTLLSTSTTSPYSYNWTNVAVGAYTITAKAYDNLGATSTSSVNVTVNPNTSPVLSFISPGNNAVFTGPANINIAVNATDSDGSIVKVEFYNGATLLSSSTSGPYSYNWTNIPAGNYTINAKAYDNLGAITTASVNVIVNPANKAPIVTITSPAHGASINSTTINITANASDSDGTITKVEFYNGNTLLSTSTAGPYNFNWTNIAIGNYIITAKAYDNLGATAVDTVSVNIYNGSINCSSVPQYIENGGYKDGSLVQNRGSEYKCKPYPYTGWCNSAAVAYEPGNGTYWKEAWDLIGPCGSTPATGGGSSITLTSYPNPFDIQTTIVFENEQAGNASIEIYDLQGQKVAELFNGYLSEGVHRYVFDSKVAAATYICKVKTSTKSETMSLVKVTRPSSMK